MCGIGGYISFGAIVPKKEEIQTLLCAMSVRGTDATGLAYPLEKKIMFEKAAVPAKEFVKYDFWNTLRMPKMMILHTRAATKGSEKNKKNNHPIVLDNMAMVHNGIISNDDTVFKEFNLKRYGEVDSEVILSLYNHLDKPLKEKLQSIENALYGSMACAVLDPVKMSICLWRIDNPIHFFVDEYRKILFFASTESILESLLKFYPNDMYNLGYKQYISSVDFPADSYMLITRKGVVDKGEIKKVAKSYTSTYYGYNRCEDKGRTYYKSTNDFSHGSALEGYYSVIFDGTEREYSNENNISTGFVRHYGKNFVGSWYYNVNHKGFASYPKGGIVIHGKKKEVEEKVNNISAILTYKQYPHDNKLYDHEEFYLGSCLNCAVPLYFNPEVDTKEWSAKDEAIINSGLCPDCYNDEVKPITKQ